MILYRNATIDCSQRKKHEDDEDRNIFPLTFSSETPVKRWFGMEILDHKRKSVDLTRISAAAPVFVDHVGDQVGVVRGVRIKEKRGHAEIEFGNTEYAKAVELDVDQGIRQNVSVGYRVDELQKVSEKDGLSTYRALKWQPVEISIASLAADLSVGVGRSLEDLDKDQAREINEYNESLRALVKAADDEFLQKRKDEDKASQTRSDDKGSEDDELEPEKNKTQIKKGSRKMSDKNTEVLEIDQARIDEISATASEGQRQQFKRMSKVNEIAGGHYQDVVNTCFVEGRSIDEFQDMLVIASEKRSKEAIDNAKKDKTNQQNLLSEKEERQYSVVGAIRSLLAGETNFYEKEISDQFRKDNAEHEFGSGILIPTSLRHYGAEGKAVQKRADMVAGTDSVGGFTVATAKMPLIEMLKNMLALNQTNMTQMSGLRANLSFPRQITASTAAFLTEVAAISASNPTFDEITMTPKRVGDFVVYSQQLFRQSNESIEALVRRDILQQIALAIDSAGIQGSGSGANPEGIINTTGVNSVTFGGAPTWTDVVDFETLVAVDNALQGDLAYLTTPAVKGKWKVTEKASSTAQFLWPETANEVNGYRAIVSNQISSDKVIFGNWAELLFGEWGAIELLVDQVTLAEAGKVRVIANNYIDFGVRHPVSFCISSDSGAQ